MKVVADATPLIVLAKIGYLDLLPKLHPRVHISAEVYTEVVVAGAQVGGIASQPDEGPLAERELSRGSEYEPEADGDG